MQGNTISNTVVIKENVSIGSEVIIHDFVVIYPGTIIGDRVEIFEGCVIGKPPSKIRSSSRGVIPNLAPVKIGNDSILCPRVTLCAGVEIGEGTMLGNNVSVREECKIGDDCIIAGDVSINYHTVIGNRVKIMDNTHITGNMIIEDDVFVSALVCTTNDNSIGRKGWHDKIIGPTIKRFATIGGGANLLPSITIGENAIVGASSVVTKDVPDRTVVMGIPAKVIRDVKDEELRK
jgi:acetyltransferase-like isoleucine patch superfamily enzyme